MQMTELERCFRLEQIASTTRLNGIRPRAEQIRKPSTVLDYGDAPVVFEDKGKYLDLSAKYSGQRDVLLEDLCGFRSRIFS